MDIVGLERLMKEVEEAKVVLAALVQHHLDLMLQMGMAGNLDSPLLQFIGRLQLMISQLEEERVRLHRQWEDVEHHIYRLFIQFRQ